MRLPALFCAVAVSDFGFFPPVVFLGLKGFLMFTGLIEEIGVCLELRRRADNNPVVADCTGDRAARQSRRQRGG